MSKVIIGFSTPHKKKVFAELIKWWDKSDASHSYTRFKSMSWERDFIYQAAGLQSHFMSGHHFEEINRVVEEFEIEVDEATVIKLGQMCVDREGKGYGVTQVLGQVAVNTVSLITLRKVQLKNPLADGQKSVSCIEEMGYLLAEACGIKVDIDLENVSVKEFREFVRALPGAKKLETDTKTI